jgi:DNA-binding GntR family transcriptional regulator
MTSAKQEAYKNLRHRIITQDLKPNEVLSEKELMEYYHIGRTPLRDVLLELKKDGLVRSIPRSGTKVAPLDLQEIKQVIEIRINLEGLVGQLAAERITDEQLSRLREIIQAADKDISTGKVRSDFLIMCESDFHGVMYEATQNPRLIAMLDKLQGVCSRYWHYLVFDNKALLEQIDDQREMLAALEARDPVRSKTIMENHIINFSNQIKENILGMPNSVLN